MGESRITIAQTKRRLLVESIDNKPGDEKDANTPIALSMDAVDPLPATVETTPEGESNRILLSTASLM